MAKLPDNKIYITQDDGSEILMTILLYFTDDTFKQNYVLYRSATDEHQDLVYVFRYDEDGKLHGIKSDREFELTKMVLETYEDEEDS